MKMSKLSVALLAGSLLLLAASSACGRNGVPELPREVHKDKFPQQYPQTVKPQTGVFSG